MKNFEKLGMIQDNKRKNMKNLLINRTRILRLQTIIHNKKYNRSKYRNHCRQEIINIFRC